MWKRVVKGFDASVPPLHAPSGTRWVAGYIGGDTPHVWTRDEWGRFPWHHKLPIWVTSNPAGSHAENDAWYALRALYNLGVPRGKTVALDLETAQHPAYVNAFNRVIRWAGYWVWVYGSESTVFANPACAGYWVAKWDGIPSLNINHRMVKAKQYADPGPYDLNVCTSWQFAHRLWK